MTLSSTRSSETLLADGLVREWPFFFKAWEGELRVLVTGPDGGRRDVTDLCGLTLHEGGGGLVRYPLSLEAPALPPGSKLTMLRSMDMLQQVDLVPGAQFDSEVLEGAFDRVMATIQQLAEELGRAIKLSPGNEAPPPAAEDLYARVDELAARAAAAVAQAGAAAAEAAGAATAAARAAAGVLAELTGLSIEVQLVGCMAPPSGSYDPKTGVLVLRIPDCSGGNGEVILSDATDGGRTAAEGVGASEWALARVSEKAAAAGEAAAAAGGLAATAAGLYGGCDEAVNADEEYARFRRLYLTNDSSAGLPVAAPAFFTVTLGGGSVLQTCWNDSGPEVYIRKGRVENEAAPVTWLPWTKIGGPPGAPVGDIRFLPFRATALPARWYFCNGDRFDETSPQGLALAALPEAFRNDWGITVDEGGGGISVPKLFFSDGRGYFFRAVDGGERQVGVGDVEDDQMRPIKGSFGQAVGTISTNPAGFYSYADGAFKLFRYHNYYGWNGGSGVASYSVELNSATLGQNFSGIDTHGLNIGMTPAIYLGV